MTKAVILAGGMGTRLKPLTDIVNKFLLPIYDKLLIEYLIENFKRAGITEIAIVLGRKSAGHTIEYLQSGKKYGVNFTYFFQDEPLGIPNALSYAKNFAEGQEIVVAFADNLFFNEIGDFVKSYKKGCLVTCKVIDDKEEIKKFGVLRKDEQGNIIDLEEKPQNPKSNLALAGIQIFDSQVWNIIDNLKPSARGEYEITDIINEYINRKEFEYDILTKDWLDIGNKDALFKAQQILYYKNNESEEKSCQNIKIKDML